MASAAGPRTVLIVSPVDSPAVADDAETLAAEFRVLRAGGRGPAALFRAAAGALASGIVCAWFLSVYGAVAVLVGRLAGRRTVIVLGGVDVARDEEHRYGLWLSPWRAFLARRALVAADLVLPVSESLRDDAVRLARYDGANIRVLPTGYDPGFWTPGGPREPVVLCVAAVSDEARLGIKGVDVLVRAAALAPEIAVTVVGVDERFVPPLDPPANVRFLPPTRREELRPLYRAAKVYCQPSRREGLPGALCEAMLCGCIPVASGVGGIPAAVGDTGFLTPPGDPAALAAALRAALGAPEGRGASARSRIASRYTREMRKTALIELFRAVPSVRR